MKIVNPSIFILACLLSATFQSVSQPHQSDSLRARIINSARGIIAGAKNVGFTTIDSKGFPRTRTMDAFAPDSAFNVVLATNPRSGKLKEVRKNNKVSLYYFEPSSPGYVLIQGKATIVTDESEKRSYWKDGWENFYKNRTTDYILIRISPIKIEVVDYKNNLLGDSTTWQAPSIQFE